MRVSLFHIKRTVRLSFKNLWMHRLRSGLTTLGIILGVSSVIAMLAVGEGASRHVQEQVNRLGSKNIIIRTVQPLEQERQQQKNKEYGLTYDDLERFHYRVPNIEVIVPIRRMTQPAGYRQDRVTVEVVGTVPSYADMSPVTILAGRFLSPTDTHYRQNLCVIEEGIAERLFTMDNPVHKDIKIGSHSYEIVGVVRPCVFESGISAVVDNSPEIANPGGANVGFVYVPLSTLRERTNDNSMELQEIVVRVGDIRDVLPTREVLESLLDEFHDMTDYQIIVPLQLLYEAENNQRIFSIVLGSIAAISLIVGGIGIMNIMLATVSERTREIGIRRAMGARKVDIIFQFLSETLLLTLVGGVLGVCLGLAVPMLVTHFGNMPTVITWNSLVTAFGISAVVGTTFGLYPAYRAAHVDPIESLRHE